MKRLDSRGQVEQSEKVYDFESSCEHTKIDLREGSARDKPPKMSIRSGEKSSEAEKVERGDESEGSTLVEGLVPVRVPALHSALSSHHFSYVL